MKWECIKDLIYSRCIQVANDFINDKKQAW